MTDKNKINETDLQDVAGGRSDANRPTALPTDETGSTPQTPNKKTRPLTVEEAASISAGRQGTPTPTSDPGDTNPAQPESYGKPRGGK